MGSFLSSQDPHIQRDPLQKTDFCYFPPHTSPFLFYSTPSLPLFASFSAVYIPLNHQNSKRASSCPTIDLGGKPYSVRRMMFRSVGKVSNEYLLLH